MDTEIWPFDQAPNVAAITSSHILNDNKPILLVTHYEDDHSWSFQSGLATSTEEGRVVGMKEILKIDSSLAEISDLLPGWSATRKAIGEEWIKEKDEWDDDEV